jgi:AraC-like DNA-binding protein
MKNQTVEIPGCAIGLPMLQHVSHVQSLFAVRNIWHSHLGFELIFFLEGASGYEFEDGETVELNGGHFLVIPPRTVHRGTYAVRAPSTLCGLAFNTAQPTGWRNTSFTLPDIRRLLAALRNASREVHPLGATLQWALRRLKAELVGFQANPHRADAQAALRAWVSAVLVEVVPQLQVAPRPPNAIASAAIAYLQKRLPEPISMTDLVRHLGFSRTRVFELFETQTGHTPKDYLQRLRIEKATDLLRNTKQSVTDIALATGFGSAQHFSVSFRQYTGVAPASYRAEYSLPEINRRRARQLPQRAQSRVEERRTGQ